MSCKSALYGANTTPQMVKNGGIVNLGTIIRRFGQNLDMINGTVMAHGRGYFDVDVNLNIIPTSSDIITIKLLKNGIVIPGAIAKNSANINSAYSVSIPVIFRNVDIEPSVLSVGIYGATTTVLTAAISINKI